MNPELREALLARLLTRLRERRYTEHELLKALRGEHCPGLPAGPLSDPLVLFRSHWSLFHCLYELRDRLLVQGEALLRVEPLDICLNPYQPGEAGLQPYDPVREVYRDLEPLRSTSRGDVLALIGSFQARLRAAPRVNWALAALDLSPPADLDSIRTQYRRLAMRHHPDRGGDAARFAVLREARDLLEQYLGESSSTS